MPSFGLSKSKIAVFEQCPKRLWLSVHKPEESFYSEATEAIFARGHEVGAIACSLYPDGIMIEAEPDMQAALQRTEELISSGIRKPLFEATFKHQGVLVRVDIMEPLASGGWHVAEVKSTTKAKDYQVSDLATQVWVMKESGVDVRSAAIRHLDTSFVLESAGAYEGIFADVELSDRIAPIIAERPVVARTALETLKGSEPAREMGKHCSDPFSCPFDAYCRRGQSEARWPVSLLPRSEKLATYWAERGTTELTELPPEALKNKLHVRIYEATKTGVTYHDPEGALRATRDWEYPRTWLDFETVQFAVPRWIGTHPFEQIPFQFSAHIEHADGRIEHKEFLSLEGQDPRQACAEALIDMLPATGTVIAYNVGFERKCLSRLAEAFPQYANRLEQISERTVDLLRVAEQYWYHPDQRGTWSIKAVLPTIIPELDYAELDVPDGTVAQRWYLEAINPDTSDERRAEIHNALRSYCGRDTEAMIHVHRRLCELPPAQLKPAA